MTGNVKKTRGRITLSPLDFKRKPMSAARVRIVSLRDKIGHSKILNRVQIYVLSKRILIFLEKSEHKISKIALFLYYIEM